MSTRTAYDRALSLDRRSSGVFAILAVIAHLGVGSVLARHARAAAIDPPPVLTEVEFIAAPEPPPPPKPEVAEPEAREDRVVPAAPVAHAAPAKPASASPPPAAAGAVITAGEGSDSPVSFVTDPNGAEYGQGVVAANGSGHVGGVGSAQPAPPVATVEPKPVEPVVKKVVVASPPRLANANACRGFFPSAADDDAATVAVAVTVQANGAVTSASVVSESPKGQGFGAAARACVTAQKFVPASGEDGQPTPASATVNVHFSR